MGQVPHSTTYFLFKVEIWYIASLSGTAHPELIVCGNSRFT